MLANNNRFLRETFSQFVPQLKPHFTLKEVGTGDALWSDRVDFKIIFPLSAVFATIVHPSFSPPIVLDLLSPSNAAFGRNGDAPLELRYEIRTLSSGHVLTIEKSVFVSVIGSERWAKIYAGPLMWWIAASMTTNASCVNAHSVPERVARFILRAHDRFGATGAIPITQSQIAEILDVRRESVNETLRQFQKEGLLSLGRNRIEIKSHDLLTRHACPCVKNTIKIENDLFDGIRKLLVS